MRNRSLYFKDKISVQNCLDVVGGVGRNNEPSFSTTMVGVWPLKAIVCGKVVRRPLLGWVLDGQEGIERICCEERESVSFLSDLFVMRTV